MNEEHTELVLKSQRQFAYLLTILLVGFGFTLGALIIVGCLLIYILDRLYVIELLYHA